MLADADALIVACPDCSKRVHAAELRDHRADKHGEHQERAYCPRCGAAPCVKTWQWTEE